jgi:hypothetical protein
MTRVFPEFPAAAGCIFLKGLPDCEMETSRQLESSLPEKQGYHGDSVVNAGTLEQPGYPGASPFNLVVRYLERGVSEEERLVQRAAAGAGEALLLGLEVFLLCGILWFKRFHPVVIAVVSAWAAFRVLGFWHRARAARRYRQSFKRGLSSMKARDFTAAAIAFQNAAQHSRQEEAALGYAYAAGLAGDMAALVRGVRRLFRLHLYRRQPAEILENEAYQAFLAEPAFHAVRPRLQAALTGEVEELLHLVPSILRRRTIQILVGLISFTVLALVLTSVLTFL